MASATQPREHFLRAMAEQAAFTTQHRDRSVGVMFCTIQTPWTQSCFLKPKLSGFCTTFSGCA
ncbi:MAG: hypothetical protein WAM09_11205 [Anaerolineales bacterium]